MAGQVTFPEDEGTGGAVDAVRANESVCNCGRAVLEVENDMLIFVMLDALEALVEVGAFGGHPFDQFVEEMGAVYASHPAWCCLVTDHFAFMLAFALKKKDPISIFFGIYKSVSLNLQKWLTYDKIACEDITVRFPLVWRCVLLECVIGMGSNELESFLGVESDSNTSAYFPKGVCGFVDLDIDMVVLEETKC